MEEDSQINTDSINQVTKTQLTKLLTNGSCRMGGWLSVVPHPPTGTFSFLYKIIIKKYDYTGWRRTPE